MITQCRSCQSGNLRSIYDLGSQHLSQFHRDPLKKPPKYPLELMACEDCTLAQLSNTASPDDLYTDSYSFKSGISEAIRDDLGDVVQYALSYQRNPKTWLDIACNDGTLLAQVPEDIWRCGIDPLKQFTEEASQHCNYIVADFFHPRWFEKPFDVITSVSMFYDLDDPNKFVAGVKEVLAEDGVWVVQQNYLVTMLQTGAVDNLSAEHLQYQSLTSLVPLLERHGLEVVDVELNPINGGCFRTLITRKGKREVQPSVAEMLELEATQGIGVDGDWSAFDAFVEKTTKNLSDLRQLVETLTELGHTVWCYAASTRGAVIMQAAGLDKNLIPFAVERNPDKIGRYFSAVGAKIVSEDDMRREKPAYVVVLPYWFREQFIEREQDYLKAGGKFIFPVPEVQIVGADGPE